MIGIITHLLIATTFVNSGYIPHIENKHVFLTEIAKTVINHNFDDATIQPLHQMLEKCNTDKERAQAFVNWLSTILERYTKKIAQKEELPFMFTKSLVLRFFFDTHLYPMLADWKLFTQNFTRSQFDDAALNKVFDTVLIPYLQEVPTVQRLEIALKNLYNQKLLLPEFKERFKAFFIKTFLPIFTWRLKNHMEKMNKNTYLVSRAEKLQGYVLKQYFKEENRIDNNEVVTNEIVAVEA